MPRTFSTKGRKVGKPKPMCEYCGYGMVWHRAWHRTWLLPGGWECPNRECESQALADEAARNYFGDEPDWTQG